MGSSLAPLFLNVPVVIVFLEITEFNMSKMIKKILHGTINPLLITIFSLSALVLTVVLCVYVYSDTMLGRDMSEGAGIESIAIQAEAATDSLVVKTSTEENLSAADDAEAISLEYNDENKAESDYTVNVFDGNETYYANTLVNVRSGAGTGYDKLGTIGRGTDITVTGLTDNGWYQVLYDGVAGYISAEYLQTSAPGTAYIFAGDSRTVQMNMAVGTNGNKWIAQVGEGYKYFAGTAVPQIDAGIGEGTVVIINFGVNDLYNVDKYVSLVNSKIDSWISAGATVYYAAVVPVSNYPTITNADIESFNAKLKSGLDSRVGWLDGYTYLTTCGFNTNDGLHYDAATYKNLYSFYMSNLTV